MSSLMGLLACETWKKSAVGTRTFALVCGALLMATPVKAQGPGLLPATPKKPVVDEYHGVKVTDDYRWLEDGKSPDVVAWTAAQDKYARSHLDPLPLHTSIYEFMKRLDSERSSSYYDLQSRSG